MSTPIRHTPRVSLALCLLLLFLSSLWLAGGASRADAAGQVIVRTAAWCILIAMALFGRRPSLRSERPVLLLLTASVLLVLTQLVPLPPAIWQALPGRTPFIQAALVANEAQPWRPLAIVPGAAANAAASLVIPFAALACLAGLNDRERRLLPGFLLLFVFAEMLVGLLQLTGVPLSNPFVNDTVGEVSGTFANRNHFATLLAIGCLVAPVWAMPDGRLVRWRGMVAMGLVLLFALAILGSGSRAGMAVGLLGLGAGLALVWKGLRRAFSRAPRWMLPAVIASSIGTVAVGVLVSIVAGRAQSISRAVDADVGIDMRSRGLATVWAMVREYFPAGSGLGGFDPMFRLHEPFHLLKFTYFNHAHNDFVEIILDAGLPGLLLLIVALWWWWRASWRAWRTEAQRDLTPRLGSITLLIVLLASLVDYPARTPIMMAIVVVAATWLCPNRRATEASALPTMGQHL
jgi:O-antigen ligase